MWWPAKILIVEIQLLVSTIEKPKLSLVAILCVEFSRLVSIACFLFQILQLRSLSSCRVLRHAFGSQDGNGLWTNKSNPEGGSLTICTAGHSCGLLCDVVLPFRDLLTWLHWHGFMDVCSIQSRCLGGWPFVCVGVGHSFEHCCDKLFCGGPRWVKNTKTAVNEQAFSVERLLFELSQLLAGLEVKQFFWVSSCPASRLDHACYVLLWR